MTQQYFQKGFVTFRDLQNALLGVSGGLESWNPITEPTKIQAGINTAPGSFILLEDYNGSPIDDISSGSRGDIIYFFPNTNRWGVISAEDKNKGVYQTFLQLQTAYPTAQNGDYALVTATSTFYAWFNSQWNNTGSNVAPDALRSTNNLSDLTDFLAARTYLDVYSKSETATQISNGVFSNANIATDANIETNKIKQATITPNVNTPANNDTQDVLNNKFTGNINEVKTKIENLPVGASSGDTLFLTNTDSAIISYKTLSKQPSTASQQAITTTANNNEVLASSFVNPIQIGLTKLNGGIWQVNIFAYAAHSGSCRVIAKIYSRATNGTETLLFTATSPLILSTDLNNPDILSIESPQQDFTVNTTDLVVVKIFVSTTRTQNTNITYYHSGSTFFSHIHTPLVPNHNDLKGIQGGSAGEYNHLTNAQVALVNDIVNRIPKVPASVVNNFAVFDANGNIVDSLKNANSFEPADATILKEAEVVNNLTSTSTNLPLSANQGKVLQDNKLNTTDAPATAISAVVGILTDTNSIDFIYSPSPQKIEANVKTANTTKINITTGVSGISANINAGTLTDDDINNTANIATSKIQNGTLAPNINDITDNDLLSTIINKMASLLPIFNNEAGKYLAGNKTWSNLNQNAVAISSDVRKDGNDNIVFSDQVTTDNGTQSNLTVRLGNTTTSTTKGGDLILQPSNGTAGSGDIVMQVAPLPNINIEVGLRTSYTNINIQNATFSHIVPSNKSSRLLVVSFATAVSAPATAVTYGGVAMTEISSGPVASTSVNVQTYYLVNPTAGTANVVITRSNSGSIVGNAVNIANVNQITPITGAIESFNNNQATTASLNVATVAGQVVIGVIGTINAAASLGASQASIFNASSGAQERGASSYELATTTTTTISYTFSNSSFAFQAFAINQISSSSLGQMQEVLRVNSQGTYANNVKRMSIYQSGQTLVLTEDLPQTLVFTSLVASNSTVNLPDSTRMLLGTAYEFINYNSFTVVVNNFNGSQLGQVIGNNQKAVFILTNNTTSSGSWVTDVYLSRGSISNDELNYLDGVTSPIQSQLNNTQPLDVNLTNLATMANITNADANKTFTVDANGQLVLVVPSSGGNVSANSLSGITTGELVLFSSNNGTTITKIDGTASQRRVLSKNSKLIASFTTTERDAILDWQNGDTIYNSTNGFAESYNGTTWIQNYRDTTDYINWIANGVNAGGTLVGNAVWGTSLGAGAKNGVFLTGSGNNQKGFWYKAIPQIAHKRIVLYADHVSGGGTGADGIFYSIFANAIPTVSNTITTANNSYTIFFNEYLDEVSLSYNGIILQTVPFVGLDSSASDIKQIRIVIDYNPFTDRSRIFAELKGAGFGVGVCIDYNDTVARNLTGQYVFACGFTVGQNNFHELHHLSIRKFYEY